MNINTKVELMSLTVCIEVNDLDLDPIMPNIELVRVIFIYYNILNFHVPG